MPSVVSSATTTSSNVVTVSLSEAVTQQFRRSECELGEPGGSVHLEGGRHDTDGIGLHAELGE